ncbi:hypothetical protein CEW88_23720 (plasmid) [Alloyangia pacifica]|uniref:Uncharacterized protein n=1 Tax=Alloyangia pacifica TaxID=311180 RepID=A0A2U8HM20_9RHOB|nr:hypothetical protein [Alloyangia pacifica]AWI86774.1 hypothetical protein CEW88_23720 [Alloyangia pacifica]
MLDQSKYTAQDALELIEADTPPLAFGTGIAVYRAAVKKLAKLEVPGLMTHDLSSIPMTLGFVDQLFEILDRQPPVSKKDGDSRARLKSRLRTVARRLEGVPVVRTTDNWTRLREIVMSLGASRGWSEQGLIPLTSSLRAEAVSAGLDPAELTRSWLANVLETVSRKRRDSLKTGARIFDELWSDVPPDLRPEARFGRLEITSGKRRSLPLPRRVSQDLEAYIDRRVAGTTVEGFNRTITVQAGIKRSESTNIYRQSVGWLFDSLCHLGKANPDEDIGLKDLARLDWLGVVAFEALADTQSDEDEVQTFPWKPIVPETIYNRTSSLITMFGALHPAFLAQQTMLQDPTSAVAETLTPTGLQKILKGHFRKEMTDAHRAFCRGIILDRERQRVLLNMHMICWSEAHARWKTYGDQSYHERMQTMNLCILAAILAIVVNIPLRARTVTSLLVTGNGADLSLPQKKQLIELHIAPERMKVPKVFDAVLEDTRLSRPRQILDWFIAGPRRELLRDPNLLPVKNRREDRLFCGIGRARYNRVLSDWTEEIGLRMTTHMFRHALASVLINCCGCPLEDAARMLGNTVAVTQRQYAFQDLMRRRGETLRKLESYRTELADTQHPGRRRRT